jgi:PhoPQ-activated pathogenicity-related protein
VRHLATATLLLSSFLYLPQASAAEALTGPLAEYVAKPDSNYGWKLRREGTVAGTEYAELTLTSQKWHDIVWKHQLFILRPKSAPADAKHALLFIGGGRWNDALAEPPTDTKLPGEARTLALVAENLKTPVAILLHVPQQPIFDGLVEDQIISLTFEKYLKSGEADWPLLLPMVKSAVRGMDATQAFTKDKWKMQIDSFTVSGASKRGWTTWLTGAVDPRAVALAPMVIDVLNMGPQMKHQKATWGDLSEQVNDYKEKNLDEALETPRGKDLVKIVDPYSYRQRLTQPKIIILGTNDRYWPLDALNLYWDGLHGEKRVMYVPNNGHGLTDLPRMIGAVHALQQIAIKDFKLPQISWEHSVAGGKHSLALKSNRAPAAARVWLSQSKTKDFRDVKWESIELKNGSLSHAVPLPESGYAAMFGELEFGDLDVPYFLSSQVKIVGAKDSR